MSLIFRAMSPLCALAMAVGCGKEPVAARQPPPVAKATAPAPSEPTLLDDHDCPGAEDGAALIGQPAPEWTFSDWSNGEPTTLASLRGWVVVVRFWTVECPYCDKTMPAIQKLYSEFRDQRVVFVGAFHDKPVGSQPDMKQARDAAALWKVTFALAFDRDWKTLNAWWLDGHHRHATSATFVIDKQGRFAHVHPGPVFHPREDGVGEGEGGDDDAHRDFVAMRDAIARAAAEPSR